MITQTQFPFEIFFETSIGSGYLFLLIGLLLLLVVFIAIAVGTRKREETIKRNTVSLN